MAPRWRRVAEVEERAREVQEQFDEFDEILRRRDRFKNDRF